MQFSNTVRYNDFVATYTDYKKLKVESRNLKKFIGSGGLGKKRKKCYWSALGLWTLGASKRGPGAEPLENFIGFEFGIPLNWHFQLS